MKREIPKGGRAERIAFARGWIRERRADEPGVRLSRGRRRLIVAGLYLLLLATVSALSNGPQGALPSILGVPPVTYLIWLVTAQVTCFMLLNYSVRGLLLGDAYIDERERELRDRATAVAYRILIGAIGFISLYVVGATMFKLGLPIPYTSWQLLLALVPLGWLATSLPQSVLAWTLPDPEPQREN